MVEWLEHAERAGRGSQVKREFFIDNLLVRIHFIIVMIRWPSLAPWDFELHPQCKFLRFPDAEIARLPAQVNLLGIQPRIG